MTYLFDTSAWLWSVDRPETLTPAASALISAAPEIPFGLSAISIYEVGQKVRKGKLSLSIELDRWFAGALRDAFVHVLPIDAEIAREANQLPGDFHGDPADRLIVATARRHNLTIITSDRKIRDYSAVQTIW